MRLKPATASLGKNLNSDLDNQEQDLSFVTLLPVEPIPEPFTKPPPKRRPGHHSRDNSFEFELSGSTAKRDQEIIFCGKILTNGGISSSSPYNYDSDGNNNNNDYRERKVHFCAADDQCLNDSTAVNKSPLRSLLMGHRSKSFNSRHHQQQQQQTASSKSKLGPSKSFAYSSSRGGVGGYAKVSAKVVATEGKKVAAGAGEGEIVAAGGDGRGFGRSRSLRKSGSFSRCFPIVGARHDFY